MSTYPAIRKSAVKLIGRLLRQGLVNPNDAIPYLLALQGDVGEGGVRQDALRLISIEGDKRPEILRQRVRRGIELGMELQLILGNNFSPVLRKGDGLVESVFGQVYADCIRSDKLMRQNLFKTLINIFVDAERAEDTSEVFHNYVGSTLAHLPFETINEILNIIHQTSSIVAVDGGALVDQIKVLIVEVGGPRDEMGDESGELSWEQVESLFAADWNAELVGELKALVKKCDSITVLLRLKFFLKAIYGIPDNRIDEYSPSESGRNIPLTVPDVMPVFDVLNAKKSYMGPVIRKSGAAYTTGDLDTDEAIWAIVNFRRLALQFDGDYDLTRAATVVVKKVAPPPKKGSKKKSKKKKAKKKPKKTSRINDEFSDEDDGRNDGEKADDDDAEEEEEINAVEAAICGGGEGEEGSDDDDMSIDSIDIDDSDFDDDEPLFVKLQKEASANKRKRRGTATVYDDDSDDFVPRFSKRRPVA